jgi:RNA polymerase sigma-70 factor (ECF subfamily)
MSDEESEHFPIEELVRILNLTYFCTMTAKGVDITKLLHQARSGNRAAESRLINSVYPELRKLAGRYMAAERREHTLQPTALVNEAYLKIFGGAEVAWNDRAHFLAVAAQQMRRVLADHGREFRAAKRGGGVKIMLDESNDVADAQPHDIDLAEQLIERLDKLDPTASRVTVMKFFAGMKDQEVADEPGVSHAQVRRHWSFARAWMRQQIGERISS